jgi:hypothetical protein
MALFKALRNLDRKFSWSFLGFLVAALFGTITVYDRFIADKHPQVYFDVVTSTAVLDIKEDLPKLEIFFSGINIREQKLSLRVVSIKVINESSMDILKGHYDAEDPIGFRVQPGKIISTELADSSNDYLARNLSFSSPMNDVVHFKGVILEAHQYFVIKLLVLHPATQTPTVSPLGHIAGMRTIPVRESYKDFGLVSFWTRAFTGSWGIQLVRLITYFVIAILVILAIVIPSILISEKLDEQKRKRVVKEFRGATSVQLNESDEFIFKTYVTRGEDIMLSMQRLAAHQKALDKALSEYRESQSAPGEKGSLAGVAEIHKDHVVFGAPYLIKEFIGAGFLKISGESGVVDPHMKDTLDHFILFLKNKGMILRNAKATFAAPDSTMTTEPVDPADKQ